MQQQLSSRASGRFRAMAGAGLPFSCSQCGGRERFRTLASLRTHIEYLHHPHPHQHHQHHHTPDPLPLDPGRGVWWQGSSLPSPRSQRSSDGRRSLHRRRRTQSVGVGTQDEEEEEEDDGQEEVDEEEVDAGKTEEGLRHILFLNHLRSPPHPRPPPDLGPDPRQLLDPGPDPDPRPPPEPGSNPGGPGSSVELGGRDGSADYSRFAGLEAAVRGRLAVLLRAADSSMQRRLARVSWELAQTARSCCGAGAAQLASTLARERRRRLNGERVAEAAREALSIQSFLESAVRQETSGRVRVQRFIETLLERIALAERLSAGGQPYSGLHDNRIPSSSSSSASSSSSRPTQGLDQEQEWVWEPRQRCRSLGYEV
ncbi:LOW QUALITY PROTEIN: hypothetical protein CRUP_026832 [Coryphaenoides rupestris]|nr:LOW QUALITY PROTEIN: hypothetical protein CRUP_026832 [Coryphaenoides rupestris]